MQLSADLHEASFLIFKVFKVSGVVLLAQIYQEGRSFPRLTCGADAAHSATCVHQAGYL